MPEQIWGEVDTNIEQGTELYNRLMQMNQVSAAAYKIRKRPVMRNTPLFKNVTSYVFDIVVASSHIIIVEGCTEREAELYCLGVLNECRARLQRK